jgi:hypothetical protein
MYVRIHQRNFLELLQRFYDPAKNMLERSLLVNLLLSQAIKVLIRQACMLRGDAKTAVQSEIRSILETVCEEQCNWCLHDDEIHCMTPTNRFVMDCNITKQVSAPPDFGDVFAPSCLACGWVEAACSCSRPINPELLSTGSEASSFACGVADKNHVLSSNVAKERAKKQKLSAILTASEPSSDFDEYHSDTNRRSARHRKNDLLD